MFSSSFSFVYTEEENKMRSRDRIEKETESFVYVFTYRAYTGTIFTPLAIWMDFFTRFYALSLSKFATSCSKTLAGGKRKNTNLISQHPRSYWFHCVSEFMALQWIFKNCLCFQFQRNQVAGSIQVINSVRRSFLPFSLLFFDM